jgi:hypothetical protein
MQERSTWVIRSRSATSWPPIGSCSRPRRRPGSSGSVARRVYELMKSADLRPAAEIAGRVLPLVDACRGDELITTIAGGMRLADYVPTRTFELTVHTSDLAVALGTQLDALRTAAAEALRLVTGLAVEDDTAGRLLLGATGRPVPGGFSVL